MRIKILYAIGICIVAYFLNNTPILAQNPVRIQFDSNKEPDAAHDLAATYNQAR